MTLGMVLKLYKSGTKVLKLKIRKFLGLIPTFVEVVGEKLAEVGLLSPHSSMNRIKQTF